MKKKSGKKGKKSVAKHSSKPKRRVKEIKNSRGPPKIMNDREIAMDFATKVHEKFNHLIKASILFGSQARGNAGAGSDVDIIFIIDDAAVKWDMELIAWYREELGKMVTRSTYPRELHVNTMKLTTWWEDLLAGDAVVLNVIRYGQVLIDVGGFFNPLKILLQKGKMKGTVESVYTALQRVPVHLARSKAAKLGTIEGVYWAMIDAAQAALITTGKLPPSPDHVPQLLKETFVDTKMTKLEYASAIRDIYNLHKKIIYHEIIDIPGNEIDKWQRTAEMFLQEMTRLIDLMIQKSQGPEDEPMSDEPVEENSEEEPKSEEKK